MAQPSLFDAPAPPPDQTTKRAGRTFGRTFEDFHAENPHILEHLRAKALAVKANGWKQFGAKALIESMRWDGRVSTDGKPFKLDNNMTARYARLLMETTPELAGFFRLR